jgi:hypothetical protein
MTIKSGLKSELFLLQERLYLCPSMDYCQVPVALTCNPSYSGDRDQEDCSLKLAQANSSMRPYLEKALYRKGLVEWLKV